MSKLPQMIEVKSEYLKSVGYATHQNELFITFQDGSTFSYADVPHDIFAAIQATDSAGKFFHGRIKGKFKSTKVEDRAPIVDDAGKDHPVTAAEKAELKQNIMAVVQGFVFSDDAFWTEDGKPDLNVISDKLGVRVDRELVDEATASARRADFDRPHESLLGSSIQPSTFDLEDGTKLSLGDVVAVAFNDSGLTVKDWNGLSEEVREEKIKAVVDTLVLKAVENTEKTAEESTQS